MWADAIAALTDSWVGQVLLFYTLGIVVYYWALTALAFVEIRRQKLRAHLLDRESLFQGDEAPPISILVPAYNEGITIVESLRSLVHLHYPTYEIIVINDGSTDDTLDVLKRAFELQPSKRTLRARVPRERVHGVYSSPQHPYLLVVDVVNGKKAMALNIGIALARYPIFCAIDGDSVLEHDTLIQLAQPFYRDSGVVAVGGVVRPANGCVIERGRVREARVPRNPWARFQAIEYLRAMLSGRMTWNMFDSLFIVSGALGMFSREAVMAVGGYRTDTIGEDMELILRLQRWAARKGQRRAVCFIPSVVCWTEVPVHWRPLSGQRARWQQGLAESLWLNRRVWLRGEATLLQRLTYVSVMMVELFGPLVEMAGIVTFVTLAITGRGQSPYALMLLVMVVVGGTMTSWLAIGLEGVACPRYHRTRDVAVLLAYAVIENFGYRQLTVVWRLRGLWRTVRRDASWDPMPRTGFGTVDPPATTRAA